MFRDVKTNYQHTIYACYTAYICQAIVNNLVPLLFVTFAAEYGLSLDKITLITTLNFLIQLCVDFLSAKFVDKIGYRTSLLVAHGITALGLISLSVLPEILSNAYAGILIAVVLYAVGGGIIEVIISPVVEACPTDNKEKTMSLLHSFYCWGHLGVVLLSTLFFKLFGIHNWHILAVIWAIVPLFNMFYFRQVPIYTLMGEGEKGMSMRDLAKNKVFWVIMLLMLCAGASEQGMSQWASAFAESALHVSKTVGDLLGPCAFALTMGVARALYGKFGEKIPLRKFMILSSILCVICYLTSALSPYQVFSLLGCAICGFSVGIFWPGTFSLAAAALPAGGTAMYALMALAGDMGCSSGPTVVGFVANAAGGNLKNGMLVGVLFPAVMLIGIQLLKTEKK